MKPTSQNVFILPNWIQEDRHGVLVLPQCRIRDLPNCGIVKAMPDVEADFRVGDVVVYDRYKQQLTNVPGHKETLTMVKVEDIVAVVIGKHCYLHPGRVAADWLSIPCAPGGRIYICSECVADADILRKTWAVYSKEHAKNIKVFKQPLNRGN